MAVELFGPSDVPRTVALSDLRGVDLTAEEGFLLSRIDGRVNVGALLSLVAWDRDKTFLLLESLLRKHVVNFDRKEIQERAFQAHDGAKSLGSNGIMNGSAPAPKAVVFDRDQIEKVADLDPDRCVDVLEWELRIAEAVSPFEVFGLPEGADQKSVKRQYRSVALSFHPDKFFRKEIGGYRPRIENAWKKVQDAYDMLSDPARRAAYALATEGRVIVRAPVPEAPQETSGPGRAPRDMLQPLVITPLDTFEAERGEQIPLVQGTRLDAAIPSMESALTRRLKAEVKERIEKAQRHYKQAHVDLAEGRFAGADSNLKLAMQYDPANPEFSEWYDAVRHKLESGIVNASLAKAQQALANGDPKQALGFYEHALGLFPENPEINFAYGSLLLERFNNAKVAKDCLQKVVNRRPKDLAALVALATALRLVGMIKNAQRILDQAKAIAPRDARVVEEAKELKRSS